MPAELDAKGIPTCCGYRLQPVSPTTDCQFCFRAYNYKELRQFMLEHRSPQFAARSAEEGL